MTRPRFSLRGLLLLTVMVAVLGWYRDLPRQNAEQFARHIEAGDYIAASTMLRPQMIGIKELHFFLPRRQPIWQVESTRQSPTDWLRGRYPVSVKTRALGGGTTIHTYYATADGIVRGERWTFYETPGGQIGFSQ